MDEKQDGRRERKRISGGAHSSFPVNIGTCDLWRIATWGSVTCTIRARAAIAFWFLSRPQSSCGRGKRAGKGRQRRGEASLDRSMERRRFVPPDLRRDGSQRNVLNVRHVRDSPAFPVSTHSMNRRDLYNPRPYTVILH